VTRIWRQLHRNLTYANIASHAFGRDEAGLVVMTLTTLSSIGACAGYITFIVGITLPILHAVGLSLEKSSSPGGLTADIGSFLAGLGSEAVTWLFVWGCLVPFSLIRSFRGLASTTTWGNVVLVAAVAAVLYDGGKRFGFEPVEDTPEVLWWPDSPANYTLFLSPCIYLFTVHYCALPIETESRPALDEPDEGLQHDAGATERTPLQPRAPTAQRLTVLQNWLVLVKQWGKGFDGALIAALLSSSLLNAIVGALGYYFYVQGPRHVHDPKTGEILRGCEDQLCDVVVKNMAPGVVQGLVCIALCLNLALTYVLMLAPSRQYIENAIVVQLAEWKPGVFGSAGARRYVILPSATGPADVEENGAPNGEGEHAGDDDFTDGRGQWAPGEQWRTAMVRNAVRTGLVVFTAYLSLAIPHFGILAGFVGGMTDASQSLVLPPLIYRLELQRPRPSFFARPRSLLQSFALRWSCLGLAGFGVCFIVMATYANVKGLMEIM